MAKRKASPEPEPIGRSIAACQRCRLKKTKCDQRFPKCLKCEKFNAECIGLDPGTGRAVPRSYVVHLEERISMLELRLKGDKVKVEEPAVPEITFLKLMSTAVKVSRRPEPTDGDNSDEQPSREPSITTLTPLTHPAILPPKSTALQFIHIYFAQSNSQLPILHREEFLLRYFIPIYGVLNADEVSLASNHTGINTKWLTPPADECWFDQYKHQLQASLDAQPPPADYTATLQQLSGAIVAPKQYRKGLYFLNLVFAIASSVNHLQYHAAISESFRLAAMKHAEPIRNSLDKLEALQGMLLSALYLTMRPTSPPVWYILGSALRLCVDLDLQNEQNRPGPYTAFVRDKRRRLLWCTYSIDRQICFYLDRPVGIPDESINTPFPSELDDAFLDPMSAATETYPAGSGGRPTYKSISLSMFRIRQIQLEVQRILYTNCEVPRSYDTLNDWKRLILQRLKEWRIQSPKTPRKMNCNFNTAFFTLNYNHTLLMVHNLSLKNYRLSVHDHLQVNEAAKELISCYTLLLATKSINYTWAAVHNLFMAGTSYLYTIYNSDDARDQNTAFEVKKITGECLSVLRSLVDRCDAAVPCYEVFESLAAVVIKIKYNETVSLVASARLLRLQLAKVDATRSNASLSKLVEHLNPFINNFKQPGEQRPQTPPVDWKTPPVDANLPSVDFVPSHRYDLETFFKELETQSPHSARSGPSVQPTPTRSETVSTHSSPLLFNAINSAEGRKTFELMHQMPNDIIWDQFFAQTTFEE